MRKRRPLLILAMLATVAGIVSTIMTINLLDDGIREKYDLLDGGMSLSDCVINLGESPTFGDQSTKVWEGRYSAIAVELNDDQKVVFKQYWEFHSEPRVISWIREQLGWNKNGVPGFVARRF